MSEEGEEGLPHRSGRCHLRGPGARPRSGALCLGRRGGQTGLHYPIPLHLQPAFRLELPPGSYPASEAAASGILSLPMYPRLSREQGAYLCQQLREVLP